MENEEKGITVEEWLEMGVEIGSQFISATWNEKYEVVGINKERREIYAVMVRIKEALIKIGASVTYYEDYRVIPIVPNG